MLENELFDYVIVGAGILGSATAYYLKKETLTSNILLIDNYPACGQGNTSISNACY